MNYENLSIEEIKRVKTINELRDAVKSPTDYIGLMGHQPSLKKIRAAHHKGDLTPQELELVLNALYNQTGGEPEPFKSAKDFYHQVFAGKLPKAQPKPELSTAEQVSLIKDIMPKKKKYTGPRKPAAKKEVKIDINALPPELRKYIK